MFCIMSCFRVNMGMMERWRVFPVLRDWPWVLFTLKICAFQCEVIGNIHNFKRVCVYLGTCGKAWRQRWTGRSWICGEIHSAVLKALLFIHLWSLLACFVTHNHIKKKMQGWFRFTRPWQPPQTLQAPIPCFLNRMCVCFLREVFKSCCSYIQGQQGVDGLRGKPGAPGLPVSTSLYWIIQT